MTNGESIIAVLKPRKDQIKIYGNWVEIEIPRLGINFSCSLEWWNAEYKEPTKNNLGVDCISRKAALDACHNFAIGVLDDYYEKCLKQWIIDLPPATPQEPKTGHWILTDVEGNKVWHCNCSECGKDPQDYVGGSENWWLIKSKLPKFCPNCGAKMEEV